LYNILFLVIILSVTLSKTETYSVWWARTVSGNYDIAYSGAWLISSTICYNTLVRYDTYINGVYTNNFYTYTDYIPYRSVSSTLRYFSTTHGYTYVSNILTLTISYYPSYTETYLYTDCNIMVNSEIYISFSTNIQYSTITRILALSPSSLPMNKCTCIIPLCNRIDLVLLTINNIV
jgi:hypothetical protein